MEVVPKNNLYLAFSCIGKLDTKGSDPFSVYFPEEIFLLDKPKELDF